MKNSTKAAQIIATLNAWNANQPAIRASLMNDFLATR